MQDKESTETVLFFKNTKFTVTLFLILFLLAGIGIRLFDFTDLPLDFSATRQLHSFIMARGLYYQMDTPETNALPENLRSFGIKLGKSITIIEPPVMEHLVAYTYRLIGGENILVPRIYGILFWVIGGIPLFLLMRKMISINGAFAALAFYLFLPFGVYVSRCFQPDVLMVMLILWAWYFQMRWSDSNKIQWAILAGVFSGLAIYIKSPAIFFVGPPLIGLVLLKGFKQWIKNWQVYLIFVLSVLPTLLSFLTRQLVTGDASSVFGARFFPQLFIDPLWYLVWVLLLKAVLGYFPLIIGFLGVFLISKKIDRVFVLSLWIGYLLYGFTFAHHISTHNYYQIPLLPILTIGLGTACSLAFQKWEEANHGWLPRVLILLALVFSIGVSAQRIHNSLGDHDYRPEVAFWSGIGKTIGMDQSVIALTQDYGSRLSYWGNINASLWPTNVDQDFKKLVGASDPEFKRLLEELTAGKNVFLVTLLDEFDAQPKLQDYLLTHFSLEQGDGYYLFRLDQPVQ